MSEIVNLNRFRKAKARAAERERASENAVKFGRSKLEKSRDKAEKTAEQQRLDGHQLDDPRKD